MLVRDWISGRMLDVQGLMKVAKASEDVPDERFNMQFWQCGTVACLVGNFCLSHPDDSLQLRFGANHGVPVLEGESHESAVEQRFGLSAREGYFVFQPRWKGLPADINPANDRLHVIRRLRKFLYYKMRKSELLADYEQARRTGDVGVMPAAEREVAVA